MNIVIALTVLLGLAAALVAIVLELRHVIGGDGYGHRPAPRSLADDDEPRPKVLARLAG
jgi:hypothetical protein